MLFLLSFSSCGYRSIISLCIFIVIHQLIFNTSFRWIKSLFILLSGSSLALIFILLILILQFFQHLLSSEIFSSCFLNENVFEVHEVIGCTDQFECRYLYWLRRCYVFCLLHCCVLLLLAHVQLVFVFVH